MQIVQSLSGCLLVYLSCGLVFGSAFVTIGVGRVDFAARGTSVLFRLLILPATVVLWPLLATKWIKALRQGVTP
jgi:hypothetical protein